MTSNKDFVDDITNAWNQLDAELIIKHLESHLYTTLNGCSLRWIMTAILIISKASLLH